MILVYYLFVINIITFALFGIDKSKAKRNKWRIPESTLLLFVFLGGEIGGFLGMKVFHHKTKKNKFRITVPVMLVIELILIVFCLYQNYHLVVSEYSFTSDKVTEELDGYQIVHISDLHNQFFGIKQKRLLSKIKKSNPDMIVVTGDMVDRNHTNYGLTLDFFEGAVGIAPVYYIAGNHEQDLMNSSEYEDYISKVKQLGVNCIDGRAVDVDGFSLIGLPFGMYNEPESDKELKIALSHEPIFRGADITFAGHYHGGQIIIPGKGGLISPGFVFFPEYYGGMYEKDGKTLVVSRGLGNSLAPVRINNYPEVVVVRFKHK
ncbi:MAG: DUF1294 domain-containing protein [Lachnospiraceae bacterium]|nr:DUF1294 domain-containing protein [Lachnospiraceae bacterium]